MKRVGALLALVVLIAAPASCGGGGAATSPTTAPAIAVRAPTDPSPLPNEGRAAIAPGVPTVKGGDNSVQRFGVESTREERVEAAEVAQTYLRAQAAGRWAEACSHLAVPIRANLEALVRRTRELRAPVGCGASMAAVAAKVPHATLRSAARIHVLSFRVEGGIGLLVYRDGNGTPANIPMVREGGAWRVRGLAGSPLVL